MRKSFTEKETEVFELLRRVIDPELMVNIIDLGLVYNVQIDEPSNTINIDLTLTSPGCPLGDVIIEDIEQVVQNEKKNAVIKVNLVWEPMWTLDRLTTKGKEALGRKK